MLEGFELILEFVLEGSNFILLFVSGSLASPSTEQVLEEVATWYCIVFLFFGLDVEAQFLNLLFDVLLDGNDAIFEVIDTSDTVFLELLDGFNDWHKFFT